TYGDSRGFTVSRTSSRMSCMRYPCHAWHAIVIHAGKCIDSQTGGAESGARDADSAIPTAAGTPPSAAPSDPELARLTQVWPLLPEAIRRGILAMIESALPVGR